jgi:hypothetical protein
MKELSLNQMEMVSGGSCTGAIAVGVFVGVAIGATAIWAPAFWAFPSTWKGAASLVAGSAVWIYDSCK